MSTRGLVGFYSGGKLYGIFSSCDSYFSSLGVAVIESVQHFLFEQDLDSIKKNLVSIEWSTNEDLKYTSVGAEDLIELVACDKTLGLVSSNEKIRKLFQDNQVFTLFNDEDFINDTLFCEWAYVINLDNKMLEIRTSDEDWFEFPLFNLDLSQIQKAVKT